MAKTNLETKEILLYLSMKIEEPKIKQIQELCEEKPTGIDKIRKYWLSP